MRVPFLKLAAGLLACGLAFPLSAAQAQNPDYDQPYRPQVHFSPRVHWTNDPNGLVYFHGEYHLFFQFNPFGDEWGHMSWGHAVSRDLLHWQELPVAIPEQDGEMAFTGSVVVDHNTSGFCAPKTECLVAVYTGHRSAKPVRQVQNLAYSIDDGRTWTRYAGNPVLDLHLSNFRDPSVSWDDKHHHWLMAVSLAGEHKVRFYSSPDLKQWTQLSDFGPAGNVAGAWECPDFLHIPGANGKDGMWALKIGINPGAPQGGSGEQYFLGSFDGTQFNAAGGPGTYGWTNYGKDDYCAISFNGLPKNARPILLGWMNNWQYASKQPTSPWRGQMSLPRQLSLLHDKAGLALVQEPVIAPLRAAHSTISAPPKGDLLATQDTPFELDLDFKHPAGSPFGIRIYSDDRHWTEIGFDPAKKTFYIDRTNSSIEVAPEFPVRTEAPLVSRRPYDFKLVVDRSSIEAFAQGGTIAMTDLIFPPSQHGKIVVFPAGTKPASVHGDLWQLRSIWK